MRKNKHDYQVSVRRFPGHDKYPYQIYVRAVWNGMVYQTEVVKEYCNILMVLGELRADGVVMLNDVQNPTYFDSEQLQKALDRIVVTYRDKSIVSLVRTLTKGVEKLPPNTFAVNGRRYDCNWPLQLEVILLSDSYLVGYHHI